MGLKQDIIGLNLSGKIETGLLKLVEALENGGGAGDGNLETVRLPKGALTAGDVDKWVMNKNGVAEITEIEGATAGVNAEYEVTIGTDFLLPQSAVYTIEFTQQPLNGNYVVFLNGDYTVYFGTDVAIGATVGDTRDNLIAWITANLVPNYVSVISTTLNGNPSIEITLDGTTNDSNIMGGYNAFIETNESLLTVEEVQEYVSNIVKYAERGDILLEITTNSNGYSEARFDDLMNFNGGGTYMSKHIYGYYIPLTAEDWAKCLQEYLDSNFNGFLTSTVVNNVVTIVENQEDGLFIQSDNVNVNNTVQGQPAIPDFILYPVIGRVREIDGADVVIDVSDINEIILPNDHNFVALDFNSSITIYNDLYIVWDNGEIVPLINILGTVSDDFIVAIMQRTYAFRILEEGLTGEKVKCDKFTAILGN